MSQRQLLKTILLIDFLQKSGKGAGERGKVLNPLPFTPFLSPKEAYFWVGRVVRETIINSMKL